VSEDDFELGAFFDRDMRQATTVRIFHDRIITHASAEAILCMVREEIQAALTADADLRILVRECVKEAISKMNVQEVVGLAVREHLKTSKPDCG
jgi:chlorite dismutase